MQRIDWNGTSVCSSLLNIYMLVCLFLLYASLCYASMCARVDKS